MRSNPRCYSIISPRGQSQFSIAMFTYGRILHEVKGVSQGKEDAAALSVHTCFTEEFLREDTR